MKHSNQRPPNWDTLIKLFPSIKWEGNRQIIITWGDTYYSHNPISDDLVAHEETHMRQQESYGIETWWDNYYKNPVFRLDQEVEAYRNQLQYLRDKMSYMDRKERSYKMRMYKEEFARILSSEIYGTMITYNKAVDLLIS